jgi:O-antigen/teichoic acid export membrane protein
VAASSVLVVGVAMQVINGSLFWNANTLFAAREAKTVASTYLITLVLFVPLLILLSERWGALGAGCALLVAMVQSNFTLTVKVAQLIRRRPEADVPVSTSTDNGSCPAAPIAASRPSFKALESLL